MIPKLRANFSFHVAVLKYKFRFFSSPKLSQWCTILAFRAYVAFSNHKTNACSLDKIWKKFQDGKQN